MRRQLLFATHNANLIVLDPADRVFALSGESERRARRPVPGTWTRPRRADSKAARGGARRVRAARGAVRAREAEERRSRSRGEGRRVTWRSKGGAGGDRSGGSERRRGAPGAARGRLKECATAAAERAWTSIGLEIRRGAVRACGHTSPQMRQDCGDVCDAPPSRTSGARSSGSARTPTRFVKNAAAKRAAERWRRACGKSGRRTRRASRCSPETLDAAEGEGPGEGKLAGARWRRGVEHFVGRLDHELRKSDRALERALAALDTEIEKQDRSAARCEGSTRRSSASTSGSCDRSSAAGAMRRPGVTPQFAE